MIAPVPRLAAIACFGVLAASALAPAAPVDDFAAACTKGGQRSAATCKCQAKLARTLLDAAEMRVAIDNMDGNRDDMRAALKAMGDSKTKAFVGKLRALETRAASLCK